MKTILIATDFSMASRNAAVYGLQLGKALNANIILFNAYHIPTAPVDLNVSISRYNVMKQAEHKLNEEALNCSYIDLPRVKTICDEGEPTSSIIKVALEQRADLIIVGMKGSGKNLKRIFGSTAASLTLNMSIPILVIPEFAFYETPENVVFANDNYCSDLAIPKFLIKAAQLFKSKVSIVRVIKNERYEWFEVADILHQPKINLPLLNTSFDYPVDADVIHALNIFIQNHQANILVMMPHKHDWLERLYTKSATRDMMFQTHIPLLILPETLHKYVEPVHKAEKEIYA